MKIFLLKQFQYIYTRQFHRSRYNLKNYYDTLKLKSTCSQKEIRNSFLKLSKEYHPDKNKLKNAHTEFIKISEAYNTLSKPALRRNYDLGLSRFQTPGPEPQVRYAQTQTWQDETFWRNRDKSEDEYYRSQPYYGIKGIDRVSNFWVVIACFVITFLGIGMQVLAVRSSVTLRRKKLLEDSAELEKELERLREEAQRNGIARQIALFKEISYRRS